MTLGIAILQHSIFPEFIYRWAKKLQQQKQHPFNEGLASLGLLDVSFK